MVLLANNNLSTIINTITKTKCFPMEILATGMVPGTVYTVTVSGVNVGAFCKPFGGNLGDPLISDISGRCQFLWLLNIDYNGNMISNSTLNIQTINKNLVMLFTDPGGNSNEVYIPVLMKPTQ